MSAHLTLPQAYALLLLRPDGKLTDAEQTFDPGVAGAVLGDLALRGLVQFDGRKVIPVKSAPVGDPVIDGMKERIDASSSPRRPATWVSRYANATVGRAVLTGLVGRGVVARQEHRVLGIFPSVRWPERDGGPAKLLRVELSDVLHDGVAPSPFAAALIGLLSATNSLRGQFGAVDRQRVKALTTGDWVADAVKSVVQTRHTSTTIGAGAVGPMSSSS
ncbi:GPP34 family phosphoprotein [Curtobacterium sp. MCBD17_008]|uniref:GOLPH3/VPS74 family protein n=1 Tax=Curtobacterium sp. MCBD17_008 TaxID=2175656 RepID=UPI0015E88D67|nr:GPP34 family phosphoprotein [Curtobacterium sp. MCBD17_008]